MVGVPALEKCPAGPSSRICWPMPRARSWLISNGCPQDGDQKSHAAGNQQRLHLAPTRRVAARRPARVGSARLSASGRPGPRRRRRTARRGSQNPGQSRGLCRRSARRRRPWPSPGRSAMARARSTSTRGAAAPVGAAGHLFDDGQRLLIARVVRGDDDHVRQLAGDLAHERALGPVPVAAGAEHNRSAGPLLWRPASPGPSRVAFSRQLATPPAEQPPACGRSRPAR